MAKGYFVKGNYRVGPGSKRKRPEHPRISTTTDGTVVIKNGRSLKSCKKAVTRLKRGLGKK